MNTNRIRLFTLLFIFTIISTALSARTYYVTPEGIDANPGSKSKPWKTVQKAADTMNPGDQVIVSEGTYDETVKTKVDGQPGKRIVFKTSGLAKIKGFRIDHSYITIDGFEIIPKNSIILTKSNVEILNNHCIDSFIRITHDSNAFNCLIKGNHVESSYPWGSDWPAIEIWGSNNLVEKNEVGPSVDTDAFRLFGHDNTIRGNYIHNITRSPGSKAHTDIFQTFSVADYYLSYNIVFENNLIRDNDAQLFMTSSDGSKKMHDYDIRNNIIINNALQGNVGVPNLRFYNNTCINVDPANGFALFIDQIPEKDCTGCQVMNNIFIGCGGENNTSMRGAYYIRGDVKDYKCDYNYVARGASHNYAPLTGDKEEHGINGGDPMFVDPANNDYHLKPNSPAIDKGTALPGFNYDREGNKRPIGAGWDIGAFEYSFKKGFKK